MDTAAEYEVLRGGIEREFSDNRNDIENQYISDRNARTAQYQADIKANEQARRDALVAAGLNSDGSDPQGRPTG
jgi:hypothetical protein